MNAERFRQLLDSYGSDEKRWPSHLRGSMTDFLDATPEARQWLQEARELDVLLDGYQPTTVDLSVRIMAALPRSALDRFLDWLLPSAPAQWWHPVAAGAMPLVLGLAIGLNTPGITDQDSLEWELQEQVLLMSSATGNWYE